MWKLPVGIGICALPLLMAAVPESRLPAVLPEAAVQDEKEAKVRELLELTGAADMGKQMMEQMMEPFEDMPGLPNGFAEKFLALADPDEIVELIVPIYLEELEEKTIDGAIVYFKSEPGRAWIAAQPDILRASTAAGQKWGADIAAQVFGK